MYVWSLVPPNSRTECIPNIGFPMSTVRISILPVEILPNVEPPIMSERLTNFWTGTPAWAGSSSGYWISPVVARGGTNSQSTIVHGIGPVDPGAGCRSVRTNRGSWFNNRVEQDPGSGNKGTWTLGIFDFRFSNVDWLQINKSFHKYNKFYKPYLCYLY